MKSYLQFVSVAVLGCLARGIVATAAMTVDSTSGAVTADEISSFKTYMATVAPATTNYDNLLSHNQGGENLEGLGVMYEVTGDQAILDRFIQFADAALAARNSTTTGLINWDGNREPTWPIGASGSDEEPTTEAENGDVIAHIAYCAQLILERGQLLGSSFLNSAPSVGDPDGFGSTYLARATTYINACDQTEQNYMLVWFVNATSHQYITPSDTRYTGWHNNRPFPWNQQMMMNGGLERLAECHELLGDNSPYIAQYNQIVQTSVSAFVADLEANQTTASNGDPVYVWSYFADPPSVEYSVEDNSAHSSYDLLGLFRAYEQGGFSVPTSVMVNLANTMSDVIYLGSDFAGNVDGSGTTRSTLWSEWLYSAEFRTDAYTILANADLGSASTNMNYFARLMFEKNRRYQQFGLAASAPSLTVIAGTSDTDSVAVQSLGAYAGTVALTSSGAPSGVSPTFSPASLAISVNNNLLTSTLTVAATSGTAAGTYPITLKGTSGAITQSQAISVTVLASGGPYTLGCSTLTPTNSGGTISTSSDANATGGVLLYLNSTASGQWLQLTTPTLPAGTYQVSFRYKQNTNRGQHTIMVDGTQLGGVIDQYASASAYTTETLGQIKFATNATHALRLIVSGKNASSTSYALSADSFVFTAVSPLAGANIGSEPIGGSASLSGSTYTVQGCGSDIYNTADQFEYASSATSGDQTVIAEVLSQTDTNAWAKSGVMIRASTAAGSAFVDVSVTPGNGVDMQYRSATNGSAADLARVASVAAPSWVKLVRSGNLFTGYCSPDGLNWTSVGSVTVTMSSSVTAGVSVCSHNTAAACTTTFGSVSLQ